MEQDFEKCRKNIFLFPQVIFNYFFRVTLYCWPSSHFAQTFLFRELVDANRNYKAEIRRLAKSNVPLEQTDFGRIQKLIRKIMLNSRGLPNNNTKTLNKIKETVETETNQKDQAEQSVVTK